MPAEILLNVTKKEAAFAASFLVIAFLLECSIQIKIDKLQLR